MDTAIGVFSARDHAEEAVTELRKQGVPDDSIVFLTRSEGEAKTIAKQFGATVGGFVGGATGMSAGVVAATLLLPGVGAVFALGLGSFAAQDNESPQPTPSGKSSEDANFFREVLREGRSLIVVRAKSPETAASACAVLDRLGIGMQGKTPIRMQTKSRQIGDVVVLDVSGRITLGEGNVMLRDIVRDLSDKGTNRIVLNLNEVHYIDSSGLGELVKTHTTIRNKGGELKLASLSKRVHDLLEMTRLASVFDIQKDESSAIQSFGSKAPPRANA
jgi:anti-sigma B factor antagonist